MPDSPQVLFVESQLYADGVVEYLRGVGFTVTTADSLDDALTILQATTVDCLVTNSEVETSDGTTYLGGLEVLEVVGGLYPDIPRLLYAEVDNRDLADEAIERDVFAYVPVESVTDAHERLKQQIEAAIAYLPARRRATRQEEINTAVRRVNEALVRADYRELIEQRVTDVIAGTGRYTHACLAGLDDGEPVIVACATNSSIETAALLPDTEQFVEALAAGEVLRTTVSCDDFDVPDAIEPSTLTRLSVPVTYEEESYGVLTIWSDRENAFDEREQQTLRELGRNVALAIHAVTTKRELAAQRAELKSQKERLATLARVISHELRNPLQTAMGRLEAVKRDVDHPELDVIDRNHDQMAFLIDDMLELTRRGQRSYETLAVDLERAVQQAWETVAPKHGTLTVESAATIDADDERLVQLLENFVRLATAGDDPVTVEVGTLPDGLYLQHDGPDLPHSEGETFELRYGTSEEGVGLGLTIIKQIAGGHDWEVTIPATGDGTVRLEIRGVEWAEA